jgi:hypothetical protein
MRFGPILAFASVTTGCGNGASDGAVTTAGSVITSNEITGDNARVAGDPAVWMTASGWAAANYLPPVAEAVTSESSTFTAQVTRLGCSSGITGEVLAPEIVLSETEIVVTFSVDPLPQDRNYACPGNDLVPDVVELGEAIGPRQLVDGACLPGGAAETTTLCADGAVRWHP